MATREPALPEVSETGASLCAFERVRVIALRAAQLMQGSTARVPPSHRATVTARHEVDAGLVRALPPDAELESPAAAAQTR